MRILAEDIVSDQDGYPYLLKYPHEVLTIYNAGFLVVSQLVITLYEINTEPSQLP
jgi:hypothetical protein